VEALLVGMANEKGFVSPMKAEYKAVRFTRNVRIIRKDAFYGSFALRLLPPSMPGLEVIGHGAFEGCKRLTLPERLPALKQIGKRTFAMVGMGELPEMPSLEVIDDSAFSHNQSKTLPSVHIFLLLQCTSGCRETPG
tara:strand:- start:15 stop:425 length:411 start_codon:yes stop_codon:yes gene_type:complete